MVAREETEAAIVLALSVIITTTGAGCSPGTGGFNCSVSGPGVIQLYKWHEPYAGLELRPLLLTGWSLTSNGTYAKMVERADVTVAVEIGVWRGLSATHIARAMQRRGKGGVLFAVDTWLGAIEFWNLRLTNGMPDPKRDLFLTNGYPSVYYTFLSNMVHANVSEYVVPVPMTSRMAARHFRAMRVRFDLIHIDAAHEYEDIREDIALWLPLLASCGVMLGDDYSPRVWPGVVRAVDELAASSPGYKVVRPPLSVNQSAHRPNPLGVKWWMQREGCKSP